MEHVIVIVSIANEGVASTAVGIRARVIAWPTQVKLVSQQCLKLTQRAFIAIDHTAAVGITKIFQDGIRHILRIGAAAIGSITHIDRDAAMVHKQSNGIDVLNRRSVTDAVRHQVVIVFRRGEVSRKLPVLIMHIAVMAITVGRIFPVVHHLRHGRSHTAGVCATAFGGAEFVVRRILVPSGLQQEER